MSGWIFRAGSRSIEFGCDLSGVGLMETPSVEPILNQEWFENPRGDGQRAGLGYRTGQVVSLSVEARPDHRPVSEVWREMLAVWRSDEVRGVAGAVASLTSDTGLTVFGHAIEIAPDQQYRLFDTDRAVLQFRALDDLWYGAEQETLVRFVPPVSGGLTFPAEAPFTFDSGPTVRNSSVIVGGDVATWPVFEIHGPVTNPVVEVPGAGRLVFKTTLAYDDVLIADTRPSARWVKRNGAPVPGVLSVSGARLSDMSLTPGAHTVLLRGYDPTGTATLKVRTAAAFTSF